MATKSVYPDKFTTKMVGTNVLQVLDENGKFIAGYNLKMLADTLILGLKTSKEERAMAGACILHLIGVEKAMTAAQKTIKDLQAKLDLVQSFTAAKFVENLPDGVYEASTLDDENELAQAKAASDYYCLPIGELYVINNMDFCDYRLGLIEPDKSGGEIQVGDGYNLFVIEVAGLKLLISEDSIGVFLPKSSLKGLLEDYAPEESEEITMPMCALDRVKLQLKEHGKVQIKMVVWGLDRGLKKSPWLLEVTDTHVSGEFRWKEGGADYSQPFRVKHNGKQFKVSSSWLGIRPTTFYFTNLVERDGVESEQSP